MPSWQSRISNAASSSCSSPITRTRRARRSRPPRATQALPEIFVPRAIVQVNSVPLLGTGKVDYVSVGQLASEFTHAS